MVFHWRADDDPTLNAGLVFQGFWTSIAKKPYIFVIFQGGGGPDPQSLPLERPCIDVASNQVLHCLQSKNNLPSKLFNVSKLMEFSISNELK